MACGWLLDVSSLDGGRERFGFCFFPYKAANPIIEPYPHDLPKGPPPNTITLGVRTSVYGFRGDRSIQPITQKAKRGRKLVRKQYFVSRFFFFGGDVQEFRRVPMISVSGPLRACLLCSCAVFVL